MSFFLKSVKNKTQKVNLKRKITTTPSTPTANGLNKKPNRRSDLNEEIASDTEDEEFIDDENNNRRDDLLSGSENDEENLETAQEKKLRLAKQYLEDIKAQKEEKNDEQQQQHELTKTISAQLREDILEKSGKLKRLVGKSYKDGEVYKELREHKLSVTCVVVSFDSKFIFSGSKDGSIVKWDLESGKKLYKIRKRLLNSGNSDDKANKGHSDQVLCLAITNDFKFLASGGADKNINIWNPSDCSFVYVFYGHRDAVTGLSFRSNTHELFSSSYDRCVKLWSVDEMSYIETLFGHQDRILGIDSLNKERCITCGARDRTIRVWKVVDESQLVFQGSHFDSIDCICLINDENFLSGSNDGSLALWHISKKKPLYIKQNAHHANDGDNHNSDDSGKTSTWITSVSALHNTDLIASGSNDGQLRVWRCSDDFFKIEELFTVKLNGFINDIKFTNDGKYIVAAMGQEHKYGRWSVVKECGKKLSQSELEFGEKVDRCLADALVKFGGGVAVGLAASLVLFKRRGWPVVFGAGTGIGMAYSNCQNEFNKPFVPNGDIIKVTDPKLIDELKAKISKGSQ